MGAHPFPLLGHIYAPSEAVSRAGMMRISLHARSTLPLTQPRTSNVPLSVLIRPSNHVEGSFEYQTDRESLLKLLREKIDLSGYVLDTFRRDLPAVGARPAAGSKGRGRGPQANRLLIN